MDRNGRPGRKDAAQRRQMNVRSFAVAPHHIPQGRRAKGLRDVPILDRLNDIQRIDGSGARGVHLRNDRGHSHGAIE